MSNAGYLTKDIITGLSQVMQFLVDHDYTMTIDAFGMGLWKDNKQVEWFGDEIEFVIWLEKTFG